MPILEQRQHFGPPLTNFFKGNFETERDRAMENEIEDTDNATDGRT